MDLGITPYLFDERGNIDYRSHADCGFKSIDFQGFVNFDSNLLTLNNKELNKYCKDELLKVKKAGMVINQLHSFWVYPPQKYDVNEKERNKTLAYYKTAIRAASYLECKYVAIHHRIPLEFDNPLLNDKAYLATISFLKELIPYARKYKIILCLENLPFPQEVFNVFSTLEIVKKVNSKYCGMCFDVGHANLTDKNIYDAIYACRDYIKIFHIHDNNKDNDYHLIPGEGNIDWKVFMKALKDIGFNGIMSLETSPKTNVDNSMKKTLLSNLFTHVNDLLS